ncbi:UDP-3-O-acylglucosamine N-acyltransferase [compost metagenome]|uniref:UDP-3-O-(3-hydroxymyristoyl)glucosamine N-acyltransferase n=1 Tax=Achromobacter sp. Root83 TaxID=1736602 RepID=UPI0009E6B7F8|nr:UDP-3-O-(3-hydroxymyristoyl)glucosamine N-acyltransferase [Achromobacter sp. Root83]
MGRAVSKPVSANDVARHLGLETLTDDVPITSISPVDQAIAGALCFAKSGAWAEKAQADAVVIVAAEHAGLVKGHALVSATPRLDFARALSFIESVAGYEWSQAEPVIHPTAVIGQNVVLGKGVVIGEGARILHNVVIQDEVVIGARSIIKSCAVVGEDGFGFERDVDGKALRLPHLGRVIIEEDVEIGSLTTVCRGTLGDTWIRRGAKIDDHVHIAHNVEVGEDAFVIACAEISGGVRIGGQAWVAPNASVLNQLKIGEKAVVGLGAVVVRNVEDKSIVAGNPAKHIRHVE